MRCCRKASAAVHLTHGGALLILGLKPVDYFQSEFRGALPR